MHPVRLCRAPIALLSSFSLQQPRAGFALLSRRLRPAPH